MSYDPIYYFLSLMLINLQFVFLGSVNDSYSKGKGESRETDSNTEALKHENLFIRLCPLLIIRLLPLKVFDDLNAPLVYGKSLNNSETQGICLYFRNC